MRIENRSELYRTTPAKAVEGVKGEGDGGQAGAGGARGDKVEISNAGRALAAKVEGDEPRPGLSAERTAEIRKRIYEGAYNSVEVVEQVARRMLERGDI